MQKFIAEILELTIKDDLTKGLRTMAENDLVMRSDVDGSVVSCHFGTALVNVFTVSSCISPLYFLVT